MDNKAQISAELIIIMAAVLAVAILLINNMQSTAKQASSKLSNKTSDLLDMIDNITE